MTQPIQCVLFDLDGTLLDTSYDFTYALSATCRHFDAPALNYQDIRKVVSQGAMAMTKLAFPGLSDKDLEVRRAFFLELYNDNIDCHTRIFPGLELGLTTLYKKKIPWGIVTNKPAWLTEKLLMSFLFPSLPMTVISGDTLAVRKPFREPMDLAAKECGIANENCIYIGDHPRDIEAGVNAKMITGAAMYGYLPEEASPKNWEADYRFDTPYDISLFIEKTFAGR